jgi:hypothetical protein
MEGCVGAKALTAAGRQLRRGGSRLTASHPLNLALDRPRCFATGDLKIVVRLKVDPELRARIEKPGKPECRIGRDRPLTFDDPCDSIDRHPQGLGERLGGQLEFVEKLRLQNLARMNRSSLCHDSSLSVVVHNLNVVGIAILPAKANSVLIVDPNAVPSCPISSELLEPVCRRAGQVPEAGGSVQHQEFNRRSLQHVSRNDIGTLALENSARIFVREALDSQTILLDTGTGTFNADSMRRVTSNDKRN